MYTANTRAASEQRQALQCSCGACKTTGLIHNGIHVHAASRNGTSPVDARLACLDATQQWLGSGLKTRIETRGMVWLWLRTGQYCACKCHSMSTVMPNQSPKYLIIAEINNLTK